MEVSCEGTVCGLCRQVLLTKFETALCREAATRNQYGDPSEWAAAERALMLRLTNEERGKRGLELLTEFAIFRVNLLYPSSSRTHSAKAASGSPETLSSALIQSRYLGTAPVRLPREAGRLWVASGSRGGPSASPGEAWGG